MSNTKMIAIAVVAIIAIAAVVAVATIDDDDNGSITIVDGKGTTITLDGPVDGVVICNTNIPKAMKILGYEEKVKGISFYSDSTDNQNWNIFSPLFPDAKHMSITKTITGEEIISKAGVKYVIAPVSSMTVSESQETAFNKLGITVIRLDCNGDSAFDDFEKLIKIFDGDKTNQDYEDYKSIYNGVVNTVLGKVAQAPSTAGMTFLSYMESKDTFYNQTSAISAEIEKVFGKNATRSLTGLDLSGVTNDATQDGIREAVIALDGSDSIDKIFVRGSTKTTTESKALELWNACTVARNYSALSAIAAGEVYVLNSDIMSGPLSYIGFVYYAEICGVDTGYNATQLATEYNEKYGFNENTTGFAFKIANGAATEIVVN